MITKEIRVTKEVFCSEKIKVGSFVLFKGKGLKMPFDFSIGVITKLEEESLEIRYMLPDYDQINYLRVKVEDFSRGDIVIKVIKVPENIKSNINISECAPCSGETGVCSGPIKEKNCRKFESTYKDGRDIDDKV